MTDPTGRAGGTPGRSPAVSITGSIAGSIMGLFAACHPLPTLAVTAFTLGLSLAAGLPAATTVLVVSAVAVGQLSIGWANDAVDADRDRRAGRTAKPVAGGRVGRRAVAAAAGVAATACVALSAALGPVTALVHLIAVAAGWAYDLGLKATLASPVPYVIAFGLLPAVVTTAAPHGEWPAPAAMGAAAVLGVAAHFANTVPDAAADALTGVRGVPQRLGPRRSQVVTAAGVLAAAVGVAYAVDTAAARGLALVAGVVAVTAGTIGTLTRDRRAPGPTRDRGTGSRWVFRATLAAVGLVVAAVLAGGQALLR